MQQKWNAKLLAIGTAPPQALWCATEVKSFRRSQGQEAARLHQDDGGLRARHRRGAGQHRVPRGCDRAAEQGRGLRRDRHRGRQRRRLDRSHQVPDADFAWLGDQRARRQSHHLEAARSEGADFPRSRVQEVRGQVLADHEGPGCRCGQLQCRQAAVQERQARQHDHGAGRRRRPAALQEAGAGHRAQGLAQARRRGRRQGMERRRSARRLGWRRRSRGRASVLSRRGRSRGRPGTRRQLRGGWVPARAAFRPLAG